MDANAWRFNSDDGRGSCAASRGPYENYTGHGITSLKRRLE